MDKMIDIDLQEASDENLSKIMRVGEHRPEELDSSQWWRYSKITMARLGQLEYGYLSTQNETMDPEHWTAMEGYLQNFICKPGNRKFWNTIEPTIYHEHFSKYLFGLEEKC